MGDFWRYKQIAAELRVLVCRSGANKPLLLNLMDHFNVTYDLTFGPEDPATFTMLSGPKPHVRKSVSLRAWVERVNVGDFGGGQPYSIQGFILRIAQNDGSSHEAEEFDQALMDETWFTDVFYVRRAPLWTFKLWELGNEVRKASSALMRKIFVEGGAFHPRYWGRTHRTIT